MRIMVDNQETLGYAYPMRHIFFLLFFVMQLAACGGVIDPAVLRLNSGVDVATPSPLVANDPSGPIPAPALPPEFGAPRETGLSEEPLSSTDEVAAEYDGMDVPQVETSGAKERTLSYTLLVSFPDAPELAQAFTRVCLLNQLAATPPKTVTGLNQRMRNDLETAKDFLHGHGYYAGSVQGKIRRVRPDGARQKRGEQAQERLYTVTISFEPGERYTVAHSPVTPLDAKELAPYAARDGHELSGNQRLARRSPPQSLAEAGLPEGAPAVADAVLDAVSEVRELYRDRGYPFAKTASTRHTLDTGSRTLRSEVVVDSGPLVFMGPLVTKGEHVVSDRYLHALRTWSEGRAWNQRVIERFRNSLRESGLFSKADIYPGEEETVDGLRPVVAELAPAPSRTVGGALKYDTDFGPGVQAQWEHRNLTGRGDQLRLLLPLWQDLQEFIATYRLPFFLRNDQDLIARAALQHEDTDAYEWTAATGAIGVERRLSRRWRGSLSVMGEGGSLQDPGESRRDYVLAGLPTTLVYDGANSLLDATRGFRVNLAAGPYIGDYEGPFSVIRARTEGQVFLPVIGKDSLVMAFRGVYGMVSADADKLPASIRYYVGGGGSVRGYEYQSLGPRNDSRAPLGGASAVEFSAEARMKFDETWGAVAFLDGGMAYNDHIPDFSTEELRWGAGVGLRFHTAIGPVRLDVAAPLNPRHKDSSMQIYFSIGQSF